MRNLRDVCDERIPGVGDLGIYNCRRTRRGAKLSVHAEGRAWDAAVDPANDAFGWKVANFFVAAAQDLGIQRVIFHDREWDSRAGERDWEAYPGPFHDNHAHVELCWASARDLTRDEVIAAINRYWEEDDLPTADEVADAVWAKMLRAFHENADTPAARLLGLAAQDAFGALDLARKLDKELDTIRATLARIEANQG